MTRGYGPFARQVAGWSIRKEMRKIRVAIPLQARCSVGIRAFSNPQSWCLCVHAGQPKALITRPWGKTVVNQTPAAPGFGPAGFHLVAFGPRGRRAPLAVVPDTRGLSRTLPRNQPCAAFPQALAE